MANTEDLNKALSRNKNLQGADLREAKLEGASLTGAKLLCAKLEGADLTGADLRGANLYGAYLQGAVLTDAKLDGANLRFIRNPPIEICDLVIEDLKMKVQEATEDPYKFRKEWWETENHVYEEFVDWIKDLSKAPNMQKKEYKKTLNKLRKKMQSKISLRHKVMRALE